MTNVCFDKEEVLRMPDATVALLRALKAEMDKILQEAAATTSQQPSSEQSLSTSNIQQLLAALNLRADTGSAQISPLNAANFKTGIASATASRATKYLGSKEGASEEE